MATSTKKKGDPKTPPATVDIQHEEVPFIPTNTSVVPLKIYNLKEITELYLQRLSPAEQLLKELEGKYASLIDPIDVTDKAAYKAGKDAWREVQAFRTKVEAEALAMRREQNTINKAISGKEGEIVERATPLEERLQARWKAVDDEKERLEKEEEARQEAALRLRLNELTALGMTLVDGYYSIGDRITIDVATLRIMPDDKFASIREAVKGVSSELKEAAERQKKEEEERQRKLEQERQAARQANKETRSMVLDALGLVPQGDGTLLWTDGVYRLVESEEKLYDLDHYGFSEHVKIIKANIKDFQETKRRQEQQDREREERVQKQNRWKSRILALQQAGMTYQAGDFVYNDGLNRELKVFGEELAEMDDQAFSSRVVELSNEVGALRKKFNEVEMEKAEKARQLKLRKDEIATRLQAMGFRFNYQDETFLFEIPDIYLCVTDFSTLLNMSPGDLDLFFTEEAGRIKDAMEQETIALKKKAEQLEKERQAGLDDAQLFMEYIASLKKIGQPKLKSAAGKKRAAEFDKRFNSLCDEFQPKAGKKEGVA